MPPGGEGLVDVDEGGEEPEGQLEDRLVPVQVDEEGGQEGPVRQSPLARPDELLPALGIKGSLEARHRLLEEGELGRPGGVVEGGVGLDDFAVAIQHLVDRGPVGLPEVEAVEGEERRAGQPALDVVGQRRLGLGGLQQGDVLRGEHAGIGRPLDLEP